MLLKQMKAELHIPTLEGLTVDQYQRFIDIQENNEDVVFIQQKMISIFCKIPMVDVLQIKASSIEKIIEALTRSFNDKREFIPRFKMGGVEYGFIPELERITFGEMVDLDNYLGETKSLHKAMAVLFRPVTKCHGTKYDIEKYKGSATYSDIMKEAPVSVALGAMFFFSSLGRDLTRAMVRYSREEARRMSTAKQLSSEENGGGTAPLTKLQTVMQGALTRLHKWRHTNA